MQGMGARLARRMTELGLSKSEVARRLGVPRNRVSTYATDRHEPDLEVFVKLCLILQATPAQLLGLADMPPLAERTDARERWLEELNDYTAMLSDEELRLAVKTVKTMHRVFRDVE